TAGAFRDDLLRVRAGQSVEAETLRISQAMAAHRAVMPRSDTRPYEPTTPVAVPYGGSNGSQGPVNRYSDAEGTVGTVPAVGRRARKADGRAAVGGRLRVTPSSVDFGAVHQGEIRMVRLKARTFGGDGHVTG